MTWAIKHKRTGSSIVAEYECPVHGRFTRTVERDEDGDPPAEVVCEEIAESHGGAIDFFGPGPHVMPPLGPRGGWVHACGEPSGHVISAPGYCRVQRVTAARRGKDPERPSNCMDWESLAYESKDPVEVEAAERKKDFEDVRKIVKGALR